MEKIWLQTYPQKWLVAGILALAVLTLAFQTGDGEVDPAHCRTCPPRPPTATATPTLTPPPPLQACQVTGIFFNDQPYTPGTTITATVGVPLNVTVRVADDQGAPLIGANVDATVTQTTTVQAAAIPPLEDQSGTYDGVYTPENPGLYVLEFSASDLTGPRFLPCSAEAIVQVVESPPVEPCNISLDVQPNPVTLGSTVNLTATLTNATCSNGVTADIQVPGNGIVTVPLTGTANICTVPYTPPVSGVYTLIARANSPGGTCQSDPPRSLTVETTPPPTTPTLQIQLPASPIDLCGRIEPIPGTLVISSVTGLSSVGLEVTYDRSFIQVIDALGRPTPPVQVESLLPPNWVITENRVDTGNGRIFFRANGGTPITGSQNLIKINWQPQGRTGVTPINVTAVLTDALGTRTETGAAALNITVGSPCRAGVTSLQGRTDHGGVIITNAAGQQTQSYPNGLFAIAPQGPLSFNFPGYLAAQADLPTDVAEQAAGLGTFTLLAGDVNGDSAINILDLAYLAQRYQSADPTADLNADGIVNILDLALVAGNYQRQAPLATWK
ncbi:MAG: hypothetical protein HS126_12430 [Anaerolineales bacterium]|nr:hypothetical protein [Anaerolineales bacterium]